MWHKHTFCRIFILQNLLNSRAKFSLFAVLQAKGWVCFARIDCSFPFTCHNSSFSHRSGTKGVMQSRVAGAELPSKLIVHWEFQSFWEHLNSGKIDERLLGLYSFSFWRRIFSNFFFFSFHGLLQWGLDAFGGALELFERGEVGIKELTVFFGLYSILIKSRNKKLILFLIIALQNSVFQKKNMFRTAVSPFFFTCYFYKGCFLEYRFCCS